MAASLARGERVTLSSVDAFADGVAVKTVGAETFRLCQKLVDGVVLVDNAAVSGAVQDVFEETRSILEPAGALAVAGARAYLKHHNMKVCAAACPPAHEHYTASRKIKNNHNVHARTAHAVLAHAMAAVAVT